MRKLIFTFLSIAAGYFLMNTEASAQTGVLYGRTTSHGNSTGGTTYECPPDPSRICTTNSANSGGGHTVIVYQYAANGDLTGTITLHTNADHENTPDPRNGYIHSLEAPWGEWWMHLDRIDQTP